MVFKLQRIGADPSMDFESLIKLRILNSIVLLYLSINGFFVLYNTFVTRFYDVVLLQGSFFIATLLILYFQFKKKHNTAKVILFILLNTQVFITSMFLLPGRGTEYFYLLIIVMFLVIGNDKMILYSLIILDIFLFLAPQIFIHPYPDANYSYVNVITIIITISFSLNYFIIIQSKYRQILKSQKSKLEKLNIEKNDLMSIVAHDLKTPLAQIEGLVSIYELESKNITNDEKMLLARIRSVAEEHKEHITEYLKSQSVEESMMDEIQKEISLNDTIKKVWQEMLPLANAKNIKLIEHYETRNINVFGSIEGLTKIFSNLISNAIKYSKPGTEIKIDVAYDQSQVLVSINDQGPGFSEIDMHNVFKKHKVLSARPTSNETSSGMGLFIVKRYVDKMGGSIWLESKEGEGSTFHITFPII